MIYGEKKRDPVRYYGGAAAVVLIHVVLIAALFRGLDHRPAQPTPEPLRVFIVNERAAVPALPPATPPRAVPKQSRPAPPRRPAPTAAAHPARPAPSTPTPLPPPAPAPTVSPSPPAPRPVAAVPRAPNRNVAAVCPNLAVLGKSVVYPVAALRRGIDAGQVVVEFTIDPGGHTRDFAIQQSSDGVFNRAALELAHKLDCVGQGQDVRVQLPVGFRAGD